MGYSCYPESGLRTWHVAVFLGFVVLVADIASIQMLGPKTNQFTFSTAPPRPAAGADRPSLPLAPEPHEPESLPEVAPPPRPVTESR
jgi:hypothetical protein